MTTRDIEVRKTEHKRSFDKPKSRMYNFKIYQAMRKYGFENFEFSIIEECDNKELEEKERYYIEIYNTVSEGYNEALGGHGKPLWTDKQVEAFKILYENGWLLQDISKVFKSNPKTISKKLRENFNIQTKENSICNNSKSVVAIGKDGTEIEFHSLSEAARYLMNKQLTQTGNITSVIGKIDIALHNTKKLAYGFSWRYKIAEKSQ